MDFLKKRVFTQKFTFPLIIGIVSLIVIIANYTPGTFLTGWDTLHPEFNFSLSFERLINGAWRADQSLGTVAIHSHMSELPRILMLKILSLTFPLDTLRYITMLTPLLIGPLGIYFLIKHILSGKKFSYPSAFLGALFYLCNLVVVQQFVVPLEMFVFHYAFLPWTFLYTLKFMEKGSKRNFILFLLFSILIIPQSHTATLFYAYFMGFATAFISYFLLNRNVKTLKKAAILIISVLIVNSYWLLPNIYTAKVQGKEVRESQINRFFTKEAFAKNQVFGNPVDTAIGKNFLFDWQLYDPEKNTGKEVLEPWIAHIKNPFILGFGYLVFFISVLGMAGSILKRDKRLIVFFPLTLISYFILLNGTWPITLFFEFLSNASPTVKEALRFPFTKFSILYIFGLSIFFSEGISIIFNFLKKKNLAPMLLLAFFIGFIYYFYPAFQGNLLSSSMRVNIPKEYFEMFSWFEKQGKTERVAILPIHSFWGWAYYSWGYQGAGFLQFGIPQPLLDPDHNRWSKYNEQYHREMHYAIYNQDPVLFEKVLEKYNVRWIMFDESILNVSGFKNETLSWYIPEFLMESENIKLKRTFGKNIKIYEFSNAKKSGLYIYKNLPDIGPDKLGTNQDDAYNFAGTYFTDLGREKDLRKTFTTYDERFIGRLDNPILYTVNPFSDLSEVKDCSDGRSEFKRTKTDNAIVYESNNGPLCDHFSFPKLSHEKSYIIQVTARNLSGFPLVVYVCNNLTFHCNQTIHLTPINQFIKEAFIIPSYNDHGEGYTLNINNLSIIKNRPSINELKEISVREYNLSLNQYEQKLALYVNTATLISGKPGKNIYTLPGNLPKNSTLIFSERYHSGWKAYVFDKEPSFIQKIFPFLFGDELKEHVLVNNWANGWKLTESNVNGQRPAPSIPEGSAVIVVFLPQYLQFLGFFALGGLLMILTIISLKSSPKK